MSMLPAHHSKHLPALDIAGFSLIQNTDGEANGTALWLAGQCLAFYLAHRPLHSANIVELGSGTGFTALMLASMSCNVLATDISVVIDKVLAKIIANNTGSLPGKVHVHPLDWTEPLLDVQLLPLPPPYDLIVTADTLYIPSLVTPLLRTIHSLCSASDPSPTVLICFERRDPSLVDNALASARADWGFTTRRISPSRMLVALKKSGIHWHKDECNGIEIWKLSLKGKCT